MLATALFMMAVGGTAVMAMMLVLWFFGTQRNNMSVVDVGWSLGLVVMASVLALLGPGLPMRKWLIAGMVCAWGVRLGTYLWIRVASGPEDGRYLHLKEKWGASGNLNFKFLVFFLFQGALDIFLSLPVMFAALNPDPHVHALEWVGVILWIAAILGESLADSQLRRFKSDSASRRQVCQVGLWNYSRHPNYFFEWTIWLAWALFATASPWGWVAWLCPALMLYFLFRVTGIPATEEQALRTKGAAYRLYQQTTSAFVPWRKKPAA